MDDQPLPVPPALRRHMDAVFGDVLPVTTSDERDDGEPRGPSADDALLADRPPHHDRA